jgi:hypothetical protein
VSVEPFGWSLSSLVYPTKSVYYALSIEEDKAIGNLSGFEIVKIP